MNSQKQQLQIRDTLAVEYADVYTPEALAALEFMAGFNDEQKRLDERASAAAGVTD